MKTITKEYTVYSVDELTGKAYDNAYTNWIAAQEYTWNSENIQTIEKFCRLFSLYLTNYSYNENEFNYSFHSNHIEEIDKLSGSRLCAYLYNNYNLSLFNQKQYYSNNIKDRIVTFFGLEAANIYERMLTFFD